MASGSRSRAFTNGQASTGSNPRSWASVKTTGFFAASSPATNMRGDFGKVPVVLKPYQPGSPLGGGHDDLLPSAYRTPSTLDNMA